ncbi:MAG: Asp23/Gls24 family envelope stress response protein [Oscillospiraceae bacterium]|nr:Asp23/Gls24 family envelope stress response protein [Oscillospiraceae bacterium]
MKLQNKFGSITIMSEVFSVIAGGAAMECFGVKGMAARNVGDGIVRLLRLESMPKGVKVHYHGDGLIIDLHIVVEHGINIAAVTSSIKSTVRHTVQRLTSVKVKAVNVFVDSIMTSTCREVRA